MKKVFPVRWFVLGALAALSIFSSGCAVKPIDVSAIAGEHRIAPEDRVLIQLSPESAERVDKGIGRSLYLTGPVWKSVFVGDETAEWKFTVTSGKEDFEIPASGLGFVGRQSYRASGILTGKGRRFEISGAASRSAGANMSSAQRQATELAIVDIAKQCAHLIKLAEAERSEKNTISQHETVPGVQERTLR